MTFERIEELLEEIVENFNDEDRSTRERQVRTWRKLKLFWDGFSQVYYSEVAHDWRLPPDIGNNDQAHYDKPINIFRAYLESIIAALSVTVPPIKCYPDDADNPLDLSTAKAGDKIAQLIYRHNNASLLWVHALFIYCTEGMIAAYNYSKTDKKYGTYKDKKHREDMIEETTYNCPECNFELDPDESTESPLVQCPNCNAEVQPTVDKQVTIKTVLVSEDLKAKARQCIEVYGGLYVKVPIYARNQEECLYLIYSYETHYANARHKYCHIREKISGSSRTEEYDSRTRLSTQYQGEEPKDNVTIRTAWLRPAAFETLDEDECKELKKKYPNGVKVVLVNDVFAEAVDESLDEHWTLTHNPLSDHLHHDPLGMLLTSVEEITNDIISLTLQTIEHGIPQTFADPVVLDFNAYRKSEATPGMISPATPKSGRSIGDGFHDLRTATLSGEVLPFLSQVQSLGQVASGALPSLFGGQLEGSKTASEYSMSRSQSLQRLQNTWKMLTVWWKTVNEKCIPAYINDIKLQDDEKDVQIDQFGNFINVLIRRAELDGKIGKIELEANENLPMTWMQQKDVIMQLLQANNPTILAALTDPENLPIIRDAIGLTNFVVPGEEDRNKQYEEIKELLNSDPIIIEVDPMMAEQTAMMGQPPPVPEEIPSVEIDTDFDNHAIQYEIVRRWIISDMGRLAKLDNESGYKNVLLHGLQHKQMLMQSQAPPPGSESEGENANQLNTQEAPIVGEQNVPVQ